MIFDYLPPSPERAQATLPEMEKKGREIEAELTRLRYKVASFLSHAQICKESLDEALSRVINPDATDVNIKLTPEQFRTVENVVSGMMLARSDLFVDECVNRIFLVGLQEFTKASSDKTINPIPQTSCNH